MGRGKRVSRASLIILLTVPLLVVPAGAAGAQADVVRFAFVDPLPTTTALPECLDDTIGSQVGSEAVKGQLVDTGKTFHVHGTTTLTYTVTFDDGRYVKGLAVEHFAFNANAPLTNDTTTIIESRTIFSADGQPMGRAKLHAVSHVTFRDINENGQPDPGEVRSAVDRFFFTCH